MESKVTRCKRVTIPCMIQDLEEEDRDSSHSLDKNLNSSLILGTSTQLDPRFLRDHMLNLELAQQQVHLRHLNSKSSADSSRK